MKAITKKLLHCRFIASVPRTAAVILYMSISHLHAQQGPTFSASYDIYPNSQIADPDLSGGNAYLDTSEVKVSSMNWSVAYPLVFSEGRTVLVNELAYRNVMLDYSGFLPTDVNPQNLHSIEYNATVTHGLSDRWSLMGIVTPGIASDFEASIGSDDLTFQAVVVFIRAYSERFQIGYGAA